MSHTSTRSRTSPSSGTAGIGSRLRVNGLSVRFRISGVDRDRSTVHAVTDARFEVRQGECLALVGESGCGKSVMAHALLGLLPANAEVTGAARLETGGAEPVDLVGAPEAVLARRVRGRMIGLVPQSPAAHLTPVRTARAQLAEALRELGRPSGPDDLAALARRVGLRPADLGLYPHQLSGGMAQRVVNALALAGDPWLIVADEPTTGLDRPLVQTIVSELRRLTDEGRAVLLITHDLRAAEQVADRVAVMYAGRIVSLTSAAEFFARPRHPYAAGLLDALPSRRFTPIPGHPPELTMLPAGCAFRPRCHRATAACERLPELDEVACHHPLEHHVAC
ncbi:ABC transporter ATP-binding protein [Sphaerimonospora sp. CA-214678]|uniref:ABC transporter ATP-binding protein n=1 Tax=Sphaerimonospora sp. CA-214678 TaxID=3240029 RepID=UPI003D8FF879